MNEDEQVFKNICFLLDQYNVNYWVCHGTLLGIIREERLLPWDHDIDIAVWDTETSQEQIIEIFTRNGYEQELVFGDMDCLHFNGVNKKIDVSFYKVKQGIASVKWAISPNAFLAKIYIYFVQIIWKGSSVNIELSHSFIKRILHIIFIRTSLFIKHLLTDRWIKALCDDAVKYMIYMGYSYPSELMVFKRIDYKGTKIQIPVDPETCLQMTYGKNWRIPKKNYIWHEEANNLK